MYLFNS